MHYGNLVIVPKNSDKPLDEKVEDVMASGFEDWWDWYQIGGRWTGALNPDYKPEEDPVNVETCDLCKGTGTRTEPVPGDPNWKPVQGQCNGCDGKGQRAKWPIYWARYAGDVVPIETVTDEQLKKFYRVIGPRPHQHWSAEYEPCNPPDVFDKINAKEHAATWRPKAADLHREFKDHLAVVVECHN